MRQIYVQDLKDEEKGVKIKGLRKEDVINEMAKKNQGNQWINLHIKCILYIFTNLKSSNHWRFKLYGSIQ